jgi:hypothetical protein
MMSRENLDCSGAGKVISFLGLFSDRKILPGREDAVDPN